MSSDSIPVTTECLYVSKNPDDESIGCRLISRSLEPLADNHVRIQVDFSSLNYKDALCLTGHPGVAKALPIVPGIDAAGVVVESNTSSFANGDSVMVFHAQFGTECDGAYSRWIDVPGDWVYAIPGNMTTRDVMILGTAGFTAAQCVDELVKHQITPADGEIVVTGATGGVGVCAVKLLAKLGYSVVAVSGKPQHYDWLLKLGAHAVISREEIIDPSDRPLLKGRWAGAVDSVGGQTLASILRATRPRGCVTACGLVSGTDLDLSIYPFILRGVTLQGIDTAGISRHYRSEIWAKMAKDWSLDGLDELADSIDLSELPSKAQEILDGRIAGRTLVKIRA